MTKNRAWWRDCGKKWTWWRDCEFFAKNYGVKAWFPENVGVKVWLGPPWRGPHDESLCTLIGVGGRGENVMALLGVYNAFWKALCVTGTFFQRYCVMRTFVVLRFGQFFTALLRYGDPKRFFKNVIVLRAVSGNDMTVLLPKTFKALALSPPKRGRSGVIKDPPRPPPLIFRPQVTVRLPSLGVKTQQISSSMDGWQTKREI